MIHHYKLENALPFEWDGLEARAYNSKDQFERASAGLFKVTKHHGLVKNYLSDRVYLILKGSGTFIIEDEEVSVSEMDVVIIPRGTKYDYEGEMTLFLVHAPAYDYSTDVDYEGLQSNE